MAKKKGQQAVAEDTVLTEEQGGQDAGGANNGEEVRTAVAKCPVTAEEFLGDAQPFKVMIGDQGLLAEPKQFTTGSFGWCSSAKIMLEVDGVPLKVQASVNLIVIGSKPEKK